MEKFMFVSTFLHLSDPASQIIIAEQEKALRKEEFEFSRHRLMAATRKVQELKTKIYFAGSTLSLSKEKEASHE